MKLLVPTTMEDRPDLPEGFEAVVYDPHEPVPEQHRDAVALVVWDNPASALGDAAQRMGDLRWVQSLAAGPDAGEDRSRRWVASVTSGFVLVPVGIAAAAFATARSMCDSAPERVTAPGVL